MVNKFYDLTVMQPTVPDSLRSHYALLERRASESVGCQSCSAWYAPHRVDTRKNKNSRLHCGEHINSPTAFSTLSTYAHATPGMKKESAKRMTEFIRSVQGM